MIGSKTFIATPPGATIKEQLFNRGMTQKEFASRMDMSEKHISRLINGEVQLTSDMAMRLEMVLGVPARFWSNLESIYREKLSKAQAENEMDEDLEILKKIPYNDMAKNGWVEKTSRKEEKVINLRKFFEVVRLGILNEKLMPDIAYRKLGNGEKSDYAVLCWAQKAKIESRNIETSPINIEKLKEMIPEIRKMTTQDPEFFCGQLHEKLSECGIALIFMPHISGPFLHGLTFYEGKKIVMGLTVRGKDADRFWFSFFHEIGHIVLGHLSLYSGIFNKLEKEADLYARNVLIPDYRFEQFTKEGNFDTITINKFSKEVGIDAGITVGRLQKENWIPYDKYNELKRKYILKSS
ncbi:MAG: HigA family addiction module antitoxin [Erysipelotrichaceae bacterium]|jgi:HTH-type transcriptional regulator/antitoxin HigA